MNGMNENTITGKIIQVLELASGDSKRREGEKWYRQEYVLETLEDFPRKVCFQLWGEDRIKGANLQLGDMIRLTFNLESREYNGRWYTSVNGRMVEKNPTMGGAPNPYAGGMPETSNNFGGQPFGGAANANPGFGTPNTNSNSNDDLPF